MIVVRLPLVVDGMTARKKRNRRCPAPLAFPFFCVVAPFRIRLQVPSALPRTTLVISEIDAEVELRYSLFERVPSFLALESEEVIRGKWNKETSA